MHVKSNKLLTVSVLAMLLTGCGAPSVSLNTAAPQPEAPGGSFCLAANPIYLDDNEYLNDANSKTLKAMDLYGIKHCGWTY